MTAHHGDRVDEHHGVDISVRPLMRWNDPLVRLDLKQTTDSHAQPGLLLELPDQCLFGMLAVFDSSTGKHPLPDTATSALRNLGQQHSAARDSKAISPTRCSFLASVTWASCHVTHWSGPGRQHQ
jgi:hypothetical protein